MACSADSWYGPQGHDSRVDLTSVSRRDLRWYCFLGAAREGVAHDWIDFTENDERIRIVRRGDDLVLSPTYTDAEIAPRVDEFVDAGRDFIRRELAAVVVEHPLLGKNPAAQELAAEVGLVLGS
jgi:hypothetical protein